MKPYSIEFAPQQLQIVVAHLAQGQYAQVSTVIDSIKQQASAEDARRREEAIESAREVIEGQERALQEKTDEAVRIALAAIEG